LPEKKTKNNRLLTERKGNERKSRGEINTPEDTRMEDDANGIVRQSESKKKEGNKKLLFQLLTGGRK
jgi:hypothetical protein